MDRNKLARTLGAVALTVWAAWWFVSMSSWRLIGGNYLWLTQPWFGADFWSQPEFAARYWVNGGDPYENEHFLFHYPPIVIRLFSWVTLFDRPASMIIWMVIIIASIAAGTLVALRARRAIGAPPIPVMIGLPLVLFTFPVLFAIERANFDIIVVIAIIGAVRLVQNRDPKRELLAGCVLAVAPWVKLYPGLMAAGLIATRRTRMLVGFGVGGIVIGLLTPLAEMRRSLHIIQLAIRFNAGQAQLSPYHPWIHSLSVAWIRATKALDGTSMGSIFAAISPNVAAAVMITPLLGWVCWAVYRATPEKQHAVLYPLLLWICALASCLPVIANDYSLVYLPMAAAAIIGPKSGRLALATMAVAVPWWQPIRLPLPAVVVLGCKLCALVAVAAAIVTAVRPEGDAAPAKASPRPRPVDAAGLAARPLYVEIFTTSLGALLLEIAYTRIFSFKVFYYFTYVLLGIGLLGIGAGGIALAISDRLRRIPLEKLVPVTCFAVGASVLLGYVCIAYTQINIAEHLTSPLEIGKLIFVMLLLTTSFFGIGLVLASILGSRPEAASRLYAADLLGAATGCALAVPLVAVLSPPRTVVLAGLLVAVGGLRLARRFGRLFHVGVALAVVLAVPAFAWGFLPDPVVSESKQFELYRSRVWFSSWSPVFRIDVAAHPFYPGRVFLTFHDGQPGSGMRYFNGTFEEFRYLDKDPRALPFEVARRNPRVLIIGAAGGHEVVASLYFGASHVTGVELNPVTYSLLKSVFADITGHLADNPKVTLLNGDGRWFLKQTSDAYDLIWFVAPDSYAAMNASTSGAFVLSESYLYTVEMVKESLRHLTPAGVVCTQFGELAYDAKPNRTTRYLATARAALTEEGIRDFDRHVLVGSATGYPPFQESTVLTSRAGFTEEQITAFERRTERIQGGKVRHVPGRPPDESPVTQVITLPHAKLPAFFANHPYQVDPVRDDRPFFWHFARFRDALVAPTPESGKVFDYEDTIAEQVMVAFALAVTILAAVFLFLPFATVRHVFRQLPSKGVVAAYFAALGLGFMFVEVALIQRLTLLLGYPTYSLSVTLLVLLSSSGVGSFVTGRHRGSRNQAAAVAFGALSIVLLGGQALLPTIVDHFVGESLAVRILITALIVAPIGLCLGAFMPLGLRTVASLSERSREYVAWAWAVNGFFSVIASILSTMLAMMLGFKWLLLIGLCTYAVALFAITRLPEPELRS